MLIRLDPWLEGFAFAHFSLVNTNKKPAELYASAGLESCACCPNSAPHTRRRAMRVMMVVMVLNQHEKVAYVRPVPESIRKIGWKRSDFWIGEQHLAFSIWHLAPGVPFSAPWGPLSVVPHSPGRLTAKCQALNAKCRRHKVK